MTNPLASSVKAVFEPVVDRRSRVTSLGQPSSVSMLAWVCESRWLAIAGLVKKPLNRV
ncbi:MAG: hypothetical protein AAFR26_10430 [Cyanobacteria bacterium J06626_4]